MRSLRYLQNIRLRFMLILLAAFAYSDPNIYAMPLSDNYFRIAKVKLEIIEPIETYDSGQSKNSSFLSGCEPHLQDIKPSDISDGLTDPFIMLDRIINIGEKLWKIVVAGKPVYNMTNSVAHALPAGVNCWLDLTAWNAPRAKSVKVVYQNYLNMNVVEFTYRLSFIYGGQFKGRGKYITEATVLPALLNVAWGFKFDAEVDIPAVFNIGTKENPVAGMQLNVKWAVDSPLSHQERTDSYGIDGNGEINQL